MIVGLFLQPTITPTAADLRLTRYTLSSGDVIAIQMLASFEV
ncbi:hypothetical protein M3J09_010111 [Ascochyta lentis]